MLLVYLPCFVLQAQLQRSEGAASAAGLNLALHLVFPFVSERVAASRWRLTFGGQSHALALAEPRY